ncbi:MAG: threonylcarbamoyl-AMP synthase [Wolbachia endosymbiont of Fragariocoptes setiger]|nr:threonylcarbamoyl-AMP synthase [Wolbachia endosymbiont of Fragariocoptes setiger]
MIINIETAIRKNLLVCFPTETVYALACNACDDEIIKKVYQVKKRPHNKLLSIFVNNINNLMKVARVKDKHINLIDRLSPGPITYILPLRDHHTLSNTFFKNTIGIRIPNHSITIEILNKLEMPIIATSINISGEKSASRVRDIPKSIKQHISSIIEDDKSVSGIESTILDLTTDEIKVIRKGLQSI